MIFQKFKEDVVVEKGWSSIKDIKRMTLRLGILFALIAIGLGMITYWTVGWPVTIIVMIMTGVGFVWMFDLADEAEENFRFTMKVSKFWWCGFIVDMVIYVVLRFFNFIK